MFVRLRWARSPVEEDRLDQSDHVSAGVVTGTHTRHVDQLHTQDDTGGGLRFVFIKPYTSVMMATME